jgi:hypothetical protein
MRTKRCTHNVNGQGIVTATRNGAIIGTSVGLENNDNPEHILAEVEEIDGLFATGQLIRAPMCRIWKEGQTKGLSTLANQERDTKRWKEKRLTAAGARFP